MTPTELAVALWGDSENYSRSPGARKVRAIARRKFPEQAPGHGREWELTDDMAAAIRAEVMRADRTG